MRQLRFHKQLYSEQALQVAAAAFQDFAQIDRADEADHLVVTFAARDAAQELELAGEFSNYVLGATIDGAGKEGGTT